jgi:hypothetical protein
LRVVASAFGIEVDSIKCEKAEAFVRQTILELHKRQAGPEGMQEPEVHCADIQEVLPFSPYPELRAFNGK